MEKADTKKMRPGVKEIARFKTSDGKTHLTIEEANEHQIELDKESFCKKMQRKMEGDIYKIFNIPNSDKGKTEREKDELYEKESERLSEINSLFSEPIHISEADDLLYLMVDFANNFQTEIIRFFHIYNKNKEILTKKN